MQSFNISKRSIVGIVIILIGLCYLFDTMGLIDADDIFGTYWPLILILFGGIMLLDRSTRNSFGVVLVILGIFYQVKMFGWFFEGVDIWNLVWPAIIIIVGFWFIFPKKKQSYSIDALNHTVLFSGADIINTSQNFCGGELTAIFGGLDVDLRQTTISSNETIVIDAFTAFGGIDIKVPQDWRVEMRGFPLFGGWDNKRSANKVGAEVTQVVIVKCLILFGGISIK